MPRTTSFTLGEREQEFIDEQLASGAYSSASELIREAVTALASEARREAEWRASLEKGLASGRARAGVFSRLRRKAPAP